MESDIRDNPAMGQFEMPLGDSTLAVADYEAEDGRVVLLHTEVLQVLSGLGYGSRLAHGVFEALRCDGKRVIAKCPSCPPTPPGTRVRRTSRRLIADGRDVGARAQRVWATMPHAYRMYVQREFLISSAPPDPEVHWVGRTRGRLDVEKKPLRRATVPRAGNKGVPMNSPKTVGPGCCGLADRGHSGGARVDERSGSNRSEREGGGR